MTDKEIINHIPILIYGLEYNPALGPETGGIAYCNKSTLEFTNYTEEEIVNKGFGFFREFIHPDDLHKTTQTVSILLNSELNKHYEIYRVKSPKHNKYIFMKSFCSIIRPIVPGGNIQFIVTTIKASAEEQKGYYQQSDKMN
jgi:PAS domain-containing protein